MTNAINFGPSVAEQETIKGNKLALALGYFLAFRDGLLFLLFGDAVKYGLIALCVTSMLFTGLFAFLWLSGYWAPKYSENRTLKWVLIYILWAGVSVYWTPAGMTAIGNWGMIALDILMVVAATQFIPAAILGVNLVKGWVYGAVTLAALLPFIRRENDGAISYEAVLNPHNIGPTVAIATLLCLFLWRSSGKHWWGWIAALLFCAVVSTGDKTDLGCVIAAGGLFLLFGNTAKFSKRAMTALVASAVILAAFAFFGDYISAYAGDEHALYTLTGRTAVWDAAIDLSWEHPWLGNGFFASATMLPSFGLFAPLDAHNEWLQTWLTLGAVGVSILTMIYISFFQLARSCQNLPLRTLVYSLIVYAILHSITEAPFALSLPIPLLLMTSHFMTATRHPARGGLCDIPIASQA